MNERILTLDLPESTINYLLSQAAQRPWVEVGVHMQIVQDQIGKANNELTAAQHKEVRKNILSEVVIAPTFTHDGKEFVSLSSEKYQELLRRPATPIDQAPPTPLPSVSSTIEV